MRLEVHAVLRRLYVGRVFSAALLYLGAIAFAPGDGEKATVFGLTFTAALALTAASFVWTDMRGNEPGRGFLYLQSVMDMVLVTSIVHATWNGGQSDLAPIYILVIAVSATILPAAGVPLVATFGVALYIGDALLVHGGQVDTNLLLQLVVFAVVALTSAVIAARLREAGRESDELAAELAAFKLKEADVRRLTLRSHRLEGIAEMSASLAHEIKNPLASIRSAVEQLARIPRATDDEKTLSALVQRESDRLSRVLSEFMDFARTAMTNVGEVDLASVARNAARLAASQPGVAEGVRLADNLPQTSMMVEGDEDLLHRALFNLLLNAVQASPPNGEVRLEGGPLHQRQLSAGSGGFAGGAWGLVVSDQGAGVPAEIRDRLFDPFVTTKTGGSGLGLSIVQRAVQAHGGFVTVSAPGQETRFTIVLPRARQAPSDAGSGVAADSSRHR